MALVYYDIFAFLLLLVIGTFIENKKKAVLTLLFLSLLSTAISAYFFFTGHVSFDSEFYLDVGLTSLDADALSESEILGGKPYGLYVGLYLIVWITFYSFSFLASRGLRSAYLRFFKKVVNNFRGGER